LTNEDEAASQKAQAEELRAQIEALAGKGGKDDAAKEKKPPSPRAFVAKKMREWSERPPR
jgi:hypothetical protein